MFPSECHWCHFHFHAICGRLTYRYWTTRDTFIKKLKLDANPCIFFVKPVETDRLQDFENCNKTKKFILKWHCFGNTIPQYSSQFCIITSLWSNTTVQRYKLNVSGIFVLSYSLRKASRAERLPILSSQHINCSTVTRPPCSSSKQCVLPRGWLRDLILFNKYTFQH